MTSQQSDIPTEIAKMNGVFKKILHSEINKEIELSKFPFCMKVADVTPLLYKEGSLSVKDNCCPVNILSNLSKVFYRWLYKQGHHILITSYKNQFWFRKYSAQHRLFAQLEKWKGNIDHGTDFEMFLIDLFKPFDNLPHYMFISKVQAYGFDAKNTKINKKLSFKFFTKKPTEVETVIQFLSRN